MAQKSRILIVCQWPLGGIRTFLRYVYSRFPADLFELTLIAAPSIEKEEVIRDVAATNMRLVWAEPVMGRNLLAWRVRQLVQREQFDLIHSQGFFSAFHTSLANRFPRLPHLMTIHGVLEEKYLSGWSAPIKRFALRRALRNVSLMHGVSRDITSHVAEAFPELKRSSTRWEVVPNGINPEPFLKDDPAAPARLRAELGIGQQPWIFGFFGRFMPQKGFNYIIDAASHLHLSGLGPEQFVVLAVGSGDYESTYKSEVAKRGLEAQFFFRPFQANVASWMLGCQALVMPSIWEAYGLVAAEAMTAGLPTIATTCIGLRETIVDTPALAIPPHDPAALAEAMRHVIGNAHLVDQARAFRREASQRFDVGRQAERLKEIILAEIERGKKKD